MIDTAGELVTVGAVAVAEQVSRSAVPGKRFHDLLRGPLRTWGLGHVEMDDTSPVVGQDDEDEQHVERHRGHGEEIDGHQIFHMVVEKRSPGWRRGPAMADHVLGDRRFGQVDAELEQLAVYAGRAPQREM